MRHYRPTHALRRLLLSNIRCCYGVTEAELARFTGLHRRRINNHLRAMAAQHIIWKEKRYWYAD